MSGPLRGGGNFLTHTVYVTPVNDYSLAYRTINVKIASVQVSRHQPMSATEVRWVCLYQLEDRCEISQLTKL